MFDKNERKLLKMGNFAYYRKILKDSFEIILEDYNALLIGPSSKFVLCITDMIEKSMGGILRWLNPKLVIIAHKKGDKNHDKNSNW